MASILLVEDERNLSNLIRCNLEDDGHSVVQVFDGIVALTIAESEAPDQMTIEIMLPGVHGLEVCRQLRQTSNLPILMLTERAEEVDRVLGMEVGADDYLTKPFSKREL